MLTRPRGMKVVVDDYIVDTPMAVTSWYNFDLPLRVADQPPYFFKSWSDGETGEERYFKLLSNMTDPTIEAFFCLDLWAECVGDDDCCSGNCNGDNLCSVSPPLPSSTDDGFGVNSLGTLIAALLCGLIVAVSGVAMWVLRRRFKQSEKQISAGTLSNHGNNPSFDTTVVSDTLDLEKSAWNQYCFGQGPDAASLSTDRSMESSENSSAVERCGDVFTHSIDRVAPVVSAENEVRVAPAVSAENEVEIQRTICIGVEESWFQSQAEHWIEVFMKKTGCTS
mmetsp:Transcript_43056/g.104168  ORF Transcript_43056/g.104168 Transcript_43056/m.104168 type:complete len:280 (+) Transcript_43056:1352-2191(+)